MMLSTLDHLRQADSINVFGFLRDRKFWSNSLQAINGLVMDNGFNLNSERGLREFRIGIEEGEIPNIRVSSCMSIRPNSADKEDIDLLLDLSSLGFEGPRNVYLTSSISFSVNEIHDEVLPTSKDPVLLSKIRYTMSITTEVCDIEEIDGTMTMEGVSEFCTRKDEIINFSQAFSQEMITSHSSISFKELFLYKFFKESSSRSMEFIMKLWVDLINLHLKNESKSRTILNRNFLHRNFKH